MGIAYAFEDAHEKRMSFVDPEPLPRRQKILAIASIILLSPVILDGFKLINLGSFRIVPFLLLLLLVPFTSGKDETEKK